ncbi:MAG: ureidoglycolate hydrolase [Polaromonas sp.]|uniref:ureidoglycolate lyase n=1 Tax=Polaromonas sp. TaxID=1869339 RepID=UPI0017984E0E|nr:ureidoglycolate lyase [Polaromonas sp.]NMM09507.1 ureidoglycolate hydrolase [Polaromonas sp.]
MPRLACRNVTAENFAGYGAVIDIRRATAEFINEGTTKRYPDLAEFDSSGDVARPTIGIYLANARTFPLWIVKLERHLQASQVFIPMGMHRFVVVVAPGRASPEWQHAAAFVTSPGQGISLHRGTWHHGLIALNDADRFAVIEGKNYRMDTQEHMAAKGRWLDAPVLDHP